MRETVENETCVFKVIPIKKMDDSKKTDDVVQLRQSSPTFVCVYIGAACMVRLIFNV